MERWRARARLRRTLIRTAAAGLALFAVAWMVVENIGLARFLPDPASDLTSTLAIGDWPTEGGSPFRAGAAPTPPAPLRGEVVWEADLGAPPGGGAIVLDSNVYAGATDGSMHAFSASDGAPLWSRGLGAPISSTPSAAGGLIFVGMLDGRLAALDRRNGAVAWTFQTAGPVLSSPAVVDGVLFVGSSDHRLYAIDALTGKERWSFATEGRVASGPAVNEKIAIVTSQDNHIHFIDKRTAKRRFDYRIALAGGSPAIADDSVYAADIRGTVRRVRWDNREWPLEKAVRAVRRWMFRWGMASELPPEKGVVWVRQEAGESFIGTPAVDHERVYASTVVGKVLAYDRQAGAERWRADVGAPAATSPVVLGDEVVVGTRTGPLVSLDAATGAERWLIDLSDGAAHEIAAGAGALYVAKSNGTIAAIR